MHNVGQHLLTKRANTIKVKETATKIED